MNGREGGREGGERRVERDREEGVCVCGKGYCEEGNDEE